MAETNEASSSRSLDEGEEIIKLGDILKHQDDMMEEVAAVLGAGDDFNCSYIQGYMKRQALYACLTCVPQGKEDFMKAAGFCLACSYHCHDGHNLIELYTKRHFRCDCGNLKFGNAHCNLDANKDDFNYDNAYNQNFCGLYCICNKPYPDPEDTVEDDMIQCIICEDWYHSRHLNTPMADDFAEMICENCVKANDFLLNYVGYAITKIDNSKAAETEEVNVTATLETQDNVIKSEENETKEAEVTEAATKDEGGEIYEEVPTDSTVKVGAKTETVSEAERSAETETNGNSIGDELKAKPNNCSKPILNEPSIPRTLCMRELSWREKLCKCEECMALYEGNKVVFLLDPEDTVEFYENKGKEKYNDAKKKAIEAEQQLLKSLPRAPLLDALAGFNDFKEQLGEYLKQFADQQKVLTVDDVKEFFSKLKSNKRQKTGEDTYFCR